MIFLHYISVFCYSLLCPLLLNASFVNCFHVFTHHDFSTWSSLGRETLEFSQSTTVGQGYSFIQEICAFHPSCWIYLQSCLWYFLITVLLLVEPVMSPLSLLILVICVFSFLISMTRGLSVLEVKKTFGFIDFLYYFMDFILLTSLHSFSMFFYLLWFYIAFLFPVS